MAILKPGDTREIKVHDGTVIIRTSLSIGSLFDAAEGKSLESFATPGKAETLAMLEAAIVAWSYPEEVTPENIANLDVEAATEVLDALNSAMWGTAPLGKGRPKKSRRANGLPNSSTLGSATA